MDEIVCFECIACCEHIDVQERDGILVNRWGCPVCGVIYNVPIEGDFEETPPASDHPDSPIII